jgi:hypothetical protein
MRPFFDASELVIEARFVAWLDVMGTRETMNRSLPKAANFVFKLHIASINARPADLRLYPMNDGVFGVAESIYTIKTWLSRDFEAVNKANTAAKGDQSKVFMVRAAIAFGHVIEGCKLPQKASAELHATPTVRDAIVLGAPVGNAYVGEKETGPFGIHVHESARKDARTGKALWKHGEHMRYWQAGEKPEWVEEAEAGVRDYLNYCRKHSSSLGYPVDDIKKHEGFATAFFAF